MGCGAVIRRNCFARTSNFTRSSSLWWMSATSAWKRWSYARRGVRLIFFFGQDLQQIYMETPKKKQVMLFGDTKMTAETRAMCENFVQDPRVLHVV